MLLQKKLSFYDENNHVKNTKTDMNNSHIDMVQRQPSSQTKCSNLEENLLHGEGKKHYCSGLTMHDKINFSRICGIWHLRIP